MTEPEDAYRHSFRVPDMRSNFDDHLWGSWQSGGLTICEYTAHEDTLTIDAHDEVWGDEHFGGWEGDHIFFRLYLNPLVQRTLDVELTTLPERYATMPGDFDMKRFEHAFGSTIFIRKMIRKAEESAQEFLPREKLILQLRAFVSDLGHTAFSHLGDWIKQGFGGTEDSHDVTLAELLEAGGVTKILEEEGIAVEELLDQSDDWVEQDAPALGTDRIDYGARQINRCFESEPSHVWLDKFNLDPEHGIVMKDFQSARDFGLKFAALGTECFNHPTQRLVLNLFAILAKAMFIDGTFASRLHGNTNPLDDMYGADTYLMMSTRQAGFLNKSLNQLLMDISRAQRTVFALGRHSLLTQFWSSSRTHSEHGVDADFDPGVHFPDPLQPETWQAKAHGNHSPHIDFEEVDDLTGEIEEAPHALTFVLPGLKSEKPRYIDPLFYDEHGEVVKLSEVDADFKRLIEESLVIQRRNYVGRVYAQPQFVTKLKEEITEVEAVWQEQTQNPRANEHQLEGIIREAGAAAVGRYNHRVRLAA